MTLAGLLDELVAVVRRFVVLSDDQAAAVALWVAHTHALDAFDATPYLAVTSAEKRSGKTRLLDVLALLVARPWRAVTPTEAVVYRKVERDLPTLLLDEVDAIFGSGPAAAQHEGLRALLNAGNRRGTRVPRCVGQSYALVEFDIFCPKVLAGIGALPDTVADRAIPLRLRRKAPDELAERFREVEVIEEVAALVEALGAWGPAATDTLRAMRPALPAELHDRAADSWEPLLAVADLAGGEWAVRARSTAVELARDEAPETISYGVRLLEDIRTVFEQEGVDKLTSADLIKKLVADEEAPWATYRGGGLSPRGLAGLLRAYGVTSTSVRIGDRTPRGYRRGDFADVWTRYVTSSPESATFEPPDGIDPASAAGSKPVADSSRVAGTDGAGASTALGTVTDEIERLATLSRKVQREEPLP